MMLEALRHVLQRFPHLSFNVEGEKDMITLKLNFKRYVVSSADLEHLLKTPGMFEIEFLAEDDELHCYIYLSEEDEK
jgi:hypothetical protein